MNSILFSYFAYRLSASVTLVKIPNESAVFVHRTWSLYSLLSKNPIDLLYKEVTSPVSLCCRVVRACLLLHSKTQILAAPPAFFFIYEDYRALARCLTVSTRVVSQKSAEVLVVKDKHVSCWTRAEQPELQGWSQTALADRRDSQPRAVCRVSGSALGFLPDLLLLRQVKIQQWHLSMLLLCSEWARIKDKALKQSCVPPLDCSL